MDSRAIDWKGGTVTLWDLDELTEGKPLVPDQCVHLKEDLAQIVYRNARLIDIGWYPEFSAQGCFFIKIIEDGSWEKPLAEDHCESLVNLKSILSNFVEKAVSEG